MFLGSGFVLGQSRFFSAFSEIALQTDKNGNELNDIAENTRGGTGQDGVDQPAGGGRQAEQADGQRRSTPQTDNGNGSTDGRQKTLRSLP